MRNRVIVKYLQILLVVFVALVENVDTCCRPPRMRGESLDDRGRAAQGGATMQVGAFSIPGSPDWRWRIVNYAGETVEESSKGFATIALAMQDGRTRLSKMDVDRSVPRPPYRSGAHLRTARNT